MLHKQLHNAKKWALLPTFLFKAEFIRVVILAAVPFLLYMQTLRFDFAGYDDDRLVISNYPFIGNIHNVFKAFKTDFTISENPDDRLYYRPLVTVSFMLNALIGGIKPWIYHLNNILLHCTNVLLLFFLLGLFDLGKKRSFIISLLFSMHPALVPAVAWIPGRCDTILAFLIMLSFISLIGYCKTGRVWNIIGHHLFFIAALLSKESAVLLPVLAVLYLVLFNKGKNKPVLLVLLPLWIMEILLWIWLKLSITVAMPPGIFNIKDIAIGLASYMAKSILPLNLAPMPVPADMNFHLVVWPSLFLLGFIAYYGMTTWKNSLFGLAWFLIFLLPVFKKGFSEPIFIENRLYLPIIGLALAVAQIKLFESLYHRYRTACLAIIIAIITFFSFSTVRYSRVYSAPLNLWTDAVRTSPGSFVAHNNLGYIYQKSGDLNKAAGEFGQAIKLNPQNPYAYNNLGQISLFRGNYSQADELFGKALLLNKRFAPAWINLGFSSVKQKDYLKAARCYNQALSILPNDLETAYNLAYTYELLLKTDKAMEQYRKVLAIDSNYIPAKVNLKILLGKKTSERDHESN